MIVRTSGRDDGEHFDALVLGAGAAGLICAVEAARRGLAVALVDHQARAGRKLALAGGGSYQPLLEKGAAFFASRPK